MLCTSSSLGKTSRFTYCTGKGKTADNPLFSYPIPARIKEEMSVDIQTGADNDTSTGTGTMSSETAFNVEMKEAIETYAKHKTQRN